MAFTPFSAPSLSSIYNYKHLKISDTEEKFISPIVERVLTTGLILMVSTLNGRPGASCGGANISSGADLGSIQVEGLQGTFAFDSTCDDLGQMITLEMRDGPSKGGPFSNYDINNGFDQDHDQQEKSQWWGDGSMLGAPMMMIPNPLSELGGVGPEFEYPYDCGTNATAMLHNNFADSQQHACFVPQTSSVYQPAFGFVPGGLVPQVCGPPQDFYVCRGPPPPGVAAFQMMACGAPPPGALQQFFAQAHMQAQAQAQAQAQQLESSSMPAVANDSSSDEAQVQVLNNNMATMTMVQRHYGSSCSSESGAAPGNLQVVPETAPVGGNAGRFFMVPGGPKSTRKECLQRYREKKAKRCFKKNIRYHMRKINADKRPRVKGRFIKSMRQAEDADCQSVSACAD